MPGPDVDDKEGSQPVRLPDGTEPSGTSSSSNAGTAATTVPAPTASSADASNASALHAPPSSAVTVPGEQPSTSSVASPSGPAASQDPRSQLPAIPPRNYPRDARLLQYTPPQPRQRLRPSQTLPRFIRFLAAFIFIAGSGATLAAFLYRVSIARFDYCCVSALSGTKSRSYASAVSVSPVAPCANASDRAAAEQPLEV
jgi:hypothetical protein